MEKFSKRLLSLVMAVFMIVSMVPAGVFAAETAVVVNETTGATYEDLASAVSEASAKDVIVVNADISSMPSINKAITIKGAEGADVQVNCVIAENFPNVDGTVCFENLTFNERISTENNSSDQSKLRLAFYNCTFNVEGQYAIQGGSTASTPGNDVLGELYVAECTFTATSETFVGNYMIYAQCVNDLTVKNSAFNGNGLYKGAIHTGDSIERATVAEINQNTFTGFPRGIQIGNRVEGSAVSIRENTFENIVASTSEKKSGAIYVHGNASAQATEIEITDNAINGSELAIYNDGHADLAAFLTAVSGNTADGAAIAMVTNEAGHIPASPSAPTVSGTITSCLVDMGDPAETYIASEIHGLNATESVVIKLYSGETQIATTTLKKTEYFQMETLGVKIIITGESSSWDTVWEDGKLSPDYIPDKVVLYVDGEEMNSAAVPMISTNGELSVNWAEVPGVAPTEPAAPELPTATVTEIENQELTFALNFKADEVTEEQLAYYGDWYADFVLTINKDVTFNANGGADGYLSGQYDGWSENWVNVPVEDTTLAANTPLKIMEYAIELTDYKNKLTYADVYTAVKDFNCGVFFEKAFLEANPDLEVTLELRMYNPADETESYVIGETYDFYIPELPTATVTQIENEELTFALNFKADEVTEEQLAYYGDWYADYVLTINKDVTFYTGEGADGYLSGQYDAWSENWVDVPYNEAVTLTANTSLKIMEYAAELMGKPGLKYTYAEVYNGVKDFDCGVFFSEEFLAANPDLEVTLELRMFNPADETESYIIGETYVFTTEEEVIAQNTTSGNTYATVSQALALAQKGETVRLLGNVSEEGLFIAPGKSLDLNGKTLTVEYANSAMTGSHIIDSTNGKGLLKVARDMLSTLPTNEQLPVWVKEDGGFRFASASFAQRAVKITANGTEKVQFKFYLKGNSEEYLIADELADGTADNDGLTIRIKMICTSSSGIETEYFFTFPEVYAKAYGAEWTTDMMWMNIAGLEDVEEVTFSAMICYDKTVAVIAGNPVTY